MECKKLRAKLLKSHPELVVPVCCESCHEDFEEGDGDDLSIEFEGRDWIVCCSLMRIVTLLSL